MMIKIAHVKFQESNQGYSFKTHLDNLEHGDKVVVETRYGLQIATFARYQNSSDRSKATKWVVQKIDEDGKQRRRAIVERIDELDESIDTVRVLKEGYEKELRELRSSL